ncbi:MAG: RidA family protein [Candidatus Scalindua sp.]|jgi:2-iminobutanoate/2-iminopropanoate deaminase|nr:RidA family protein [Candidatus Scalindua sp.]MBT5306686.1 RidA family protein [Candidatus Scalindua sp.]MBT6045964.1 RidA family protein [Candidatus Scalindua sp.]MBT6563902.1 RidA family protein [Candidatus Scalindua sp.]MBT7213354.1 RidA family protein [Candidatus Scalindua sp.]
MQRDIIATTKAPQAIGPYSQAVRFNNLLFLSGQIPLEPESGEILKGNIKEQTKQILENLKNVLIAGGSSLDNVLKTTIFLANMEDYATVNEVYAQFFEKSQPARSTVQVSRLPMDVKIEIDAIACINT